MYGHKSTFVELDELVEEQVFFGDFSKVLMKEKDKILIYLKDNSHQFIFDVYYVLDIKNNILSLEQLLEKDYDIYIKNKKLDLRNNINDLIAQVEISKNKMYSSLISRMM